jgi:hypothetical protein
MSYTMIGIAHRLDRGAQQRHLLPGRRRRRLPGRPADHQRVVVLLVHQVAGQLGRTVEVEGAVLGERRHHRGDQISKRWHDRHGRHSSVGGRGGARRIRRRLPWLAA